MKATIDKHGVLIIEATNELEQYALIQWKNSAYAHDETTGDWYVNPDVLQIKDDDNE